MNISSHPLALISTMISADCGLADARFDYSLVQYSFKSRVYERRCHSVAGRDITGNWLEARIAELDDGWDLAFHSSVHLSDGRILHIPMLDLNVARIDMAVKRIVGDRVRAQSVLRQYESILGSMSLYASGRSFHAYSSRLLELEDWRRFTTAMLLLNYIKDLNECSLIVDERWVAHRLMEGFGTIPC